MRVCAFTYSWLCTDPILTLSAREKKSLPSISLRVSPDKCVHVMLARAIALLLRMCSKHAWHEPLDFKSDEALFVDLVAHDFSSDITTRT